MPFLASPLAANNTLVITWSRDRAMSPMPPPADPYRDFRFRVKWDTRPVADFPEASAFLKSSISGPWR